MLFRLWELDKSRGGLASQDAIENQILIDGVDITAIGLADLRHAIAIIPQHPVLFMVRLCA